MKERRTPQENLRVVGSVLFWSLLVILTIVALLVGFDQGVQLSPEDAFVEKTGDMGIFLLTSGVVGIIAFAAIFYYFMKVEG